MHTAIGCVIATRHQPGDSRPCAARHQPLAFLVDQLRLSHREPGSAIRLARGARSLQSEVPQSVALDRPFTGVRWNAKFGACSALGPRCSSAVFLAVAFSLMRRSEAAAPGYHPGMKDAAPAPIGLPPGASVKAAGEDEAKYSSRNVVVQRLIARLLRSVPRQRVPPRANGSTSASVKVWRWKRHARTGSLVGVEFRHDKLTRALQRLPMACGVRADAGMLAVLRWLRRRGHVPGGARALAVRRNRLSRSWPAFAGHCVVSVPWEPFFRLGNLCRGKDLRRWGNNPEHVQHFRPPSLRRLLIESFERVGVHGCFPWLIAVATQPR